MTLGRWIGSARSSRMVLSYQMDADIPTASRDAHAAVSSATLYPRTRLQNHKQPRGAEHADEPMAVRETHHLVRSRLLGIDNDRARSTAGRARRTCARASLSL